MTADAAQGVDNVSCRAPARLLRCAKSDLQGILESGPSMMFLTCIKSGAMWSVMQAPFGAELALNAASRKLN